MPCLLLPRQLPVPQLSGHEHERRGRYQGGRLPGVSDVGAVDEGRQCDLPGANSVTRLRGDARRAAVCPEPDELHRAGAVRSSLSQDPRIRAASVPVRQPLLPVPWPPDHPLPGGIQLLQCISVPDRRQFGHQRPGRCQQDPLAAAQQLRPPVLGCGRPPLRPMAWHRAQRPHARVRLCGSCLLHDVGGPDGGGAGRLQDANGQQGSQRR
mmetsp:Transcript_30064/g.68030  ORF Transcript_30064/g.68030 Transcript_30064/m.68030 type:complete len:210 (+) Transcript_30064:4323-4952(+)